MKNKVNLEIITPQGVILSKHCDKVIAPGEYGIITILPEHASLLSSLKHGEIFIQDHNKVMNHYFISGGFLQITEDKTTILVSFADTKEDIDLDAELLKKEELEGRLQKTKSDKEKLTELIALEKTMIRIKIKQETQNDNL